MIVEKLKLFTQKFTEAWTACSICMVQGDLSVFTLNHAITASKTGFLAGLALFVASFFKGIRDITIVWMTGFFTAVADILIHPSHFGPQWLESVVTGLGAMCLAYIYYRFINESK